MMQRRDICLKETQEVARDCTVFDLSDWSAGMAEVTHGIDFS